MHLRAGKLGLSIINIHVFRRIKWHTQKNALYVKGPEKLKSGKQNSLVSGVMERVG